MNNTEKLVIKNRTLIIPDLHHKTLWVDDFLKTQTYNELVFLGDYFDAFGDSVTHAQRTAHWLKYMFEEYPDAIFLFGNHDIPYRFPLNGSLACPGFTREKSNAINKNLSSEDWSHLSLCHFTQNFLCSHAGLSKGLFKFDSSESDVIAHCKYALEYAERNIPSLLLGAGRSRGGRQPIGGILWCDWNNEFEPLDNINQIVGHTPDQFVRTIKTNSENHCIDTHAQHVGVIEDGKFSYIDSTCPQKGKCAV